MLILWKFLRAGLKSAYGQFQWRVNTWHKIDGDLEMCANGFHACENPLQALGYVHGEILARVEVRGDCVTSNDKQAWSEMRIVDARKWAKRDSVALAVFSARSVLDVFEKKYPEDKRPRKAIESAELWLDSPNAVTTTAAANAAKDAGAVVVAAAYAAYADAADAAYAAAARAAYTAAATAADAVSTAAYAADAADADIGDWMIGRFEELEKVS
jgi:hypothetical protein